MMTRSPSLPLIVGLWCRWSPSPAWAGTPCAKCGRCATSRRAISERNRRDSLQLIRIQSNLATVATALRDMADRVEPYPVVYWRQTFDRLRADLDEAIALENTFAPAERPEAQQQRLRESVDRLLALARPGVRAGRRAATRTARWRGCAPASARSTRSWSAWSRSSWCSTTACRRKPASATARSTSASSARSSCWWRAAACWSRSSASTRSGPTAGPSRRSRGCRTSCARSRGACCASRKTCSSPFRASCTTSSARCSRPSARCSAASKRNLPAELVARRRRRGGPRHRAADAGADPRAVAAAAPDGARRLRPREGRRVVRRAVRPPARHRHALRGRRADRRRARRRSTIHIYRIVQEALTNVSRMPARRKPGCAWHSATAGWRWRSRIAAAACRHGDAVARGVGLVSMRERAELMGGNFAIRPATPRGVIVDVEVPLFRIE